MIYFKKFIHFDFCFLFFGEKISVHSFIKIIEFWIFSLIDLTFKSKLLS